ncbi:CpsD/CapB family tyrosine-protein kinase, partial [Bacteroidales bacterium OttesenSCG-928-I21]|nr:CpsD/CapB family tyrosine-protein kinase [Bacteroidales bacterium OttesenSCG-928-I21]
YIQKGNFGTKPLVVLRNPKSIFAESFRLIRTRLEFIAKYNKNKSAAILITSCESGDGKSFVSVNLAGIYAMEKKRTILIDLDLRKPSLATSLALDAKKGISNYLIGQVELDEIIIKDSKYPFDIILAGTIPPNPGELVKSEYLKELLNTLKEEYEYIIIDTSPIGLVGDAYAITSVVDANLFVVRQEKTNKSFFKNVIEQIKLDKVPNVYIVLNAIDIKKNEYSTYHGYMKKAYGRSRSDKYYEYYDNK